MQAEELIPGVTLHAARGRHPSTQHFDPLFAHKHLPGRLGFISKQCADLADLLIAALGDGPELSAGLRKLLEAKDCFVRQAVIDEKARAAAGDVS